MDALLVKLSQQQALLAQQKTARTAVEDNKQTKVDSTASSILLTPASESFSYMNATKDQDETVRPDVSEMVRLKKELDAAKNQIARQKQELDQSRVINHKVDQAIGPSSDAALSPTSDHLNMSSNYPLNNRQAWGPNEDGRSEISDLSTGPNVWSNPNARQGFNAGLQQDTIWNQHGTRPFGQRGIGSALSPIVMPQQPIQNRNYSVPVSPVSGGNTRGVAEYGGRGFGNLNVQSNRNASVFQQRSNTFDMYSGSASPLDAGFGGMNPGSAYQTLGMYPSGYQPQPIGTPLSPTAAEFRASQASANPWNAAVRVWLKSTRSRC